MRNKQGQASYLIPLLLVPLTMSLGAFAADSMHCVSARNELQAACDAGALSGAYRLGTSSVSDAVTAATTTTANNSVEMNPVAATSSNTRVTVSVVPPSSTTSGSVTVSATRKIKLMFACLFGHVFESVSASATAGGARTLARIPLGTAFPLAVSIDATGSYMPTPLYQLGVGQQVVIDLGSQQNQTACSTGLTAGSANASYFRNAMDEALGINSVAVPPVVPSVSVGDSISLNNGNGGFQAMMSDPEYSALLSQTIICPLIEGNAPYNQSRPVIGFVALKITSMVKQNGAPILTAIIVRPAVRGESVGQAYTGAYQAQVANLTPNAVHLIR